MNIEPDTERLVSTIFLLFNASGLLLYTSSTRSWRPQIVFGLIISIVGAWLLLHNERDYHATRLACVAFPMVAAAMMPKRRGNRNVFEAMLMAAPFIVEPDRVQQWASAGQSLWVVRINGTLYVVSASAFKDMIPCSIALNESQVEFEWPEVFRAGIPMMVDRDKVYVSLEHLSVLLDYWYAKNGTVTAVDCRYILYVHSAKDALIKSSEPESAFTPEYTERLAKDALAMPNISMRPFEIDLMLSTPMKSQRKGSIPGCESPGCKNRKAPLDESFKVCGRINICTGCLGVDTARLVSQLKAKRCAPIVDVVKQPNLVLALMGSALYQSPLRLGDFDVLCSKARLWVALVGVSRCPASLDWMPLLRHLHKVDSRYTAPETWQAFHQATILRKIDPVLLEQVVALGVSNAVKVTMPPLRMRKSFQGLKLLISSYGSAILAVPIPANKEVRYARVEAILGVAAVIWGMVRTTIVYSLVGIEYNVGCEGSQIQTIDVAEVYRATFDPERKPVVVVTRAHLITWRDLLKLCASGVCHVVLHVDIAVAALGYNHPLLKCTVGAPIHIIRKLAYEMYETHLEDVRNPRIIAKSGFSEHRDERHLPLAHRTAFDEARTMCKALAGRSFKFEAGHCPDFGAAVDPLGPQPFRTYDAEGRVEALIALGRKFAVSNKHVRAPQKREMMMRVVNGNTVEGIGE